MWSLFLFIFLQTEMQTMLGMGVLPSKIVYANPCKQASHIRYSDQAKLTSSLVLISHVNERHVTSGASTGCKENRFPRVPLGQVEVIVCLQPEGLSHWVYFICQLKMSKHFICPSGKLGK